MKLYWTKLIYELIKLKKLDEIIYLKFLPATEPEYIWRNIISGSMQHLSAFIEIGENRDSAFLHWAIQEAQQEVREARICFCRLLTVIIL
jgi:hypothetical protein